jgi:hypothetical protein
VANKIEYYFADSTASAVARAESADIYVKPGVKGYNATLYIHKNQEEAVRKALAEQGIEILSSATAQEYDWQENPDAERPNSFLTQITDRMKMASGIPTSNKHPVLTDFTALSIHKDDGLLVKDLKAIEATSPGLISLKNETGTQTALRKYSERFDTMSQRTILSQIGQFFMLWSGKVYGNSAFQASAGASILANSVLIYYGNRASYDEKAFHKFKENALQTLGLQGELADELLKDVPDLSISSRIKQKSFDVSDAIKTPGSAMQAISGIPEFQRNKNPATLLDGNISLLSKLVTFNTIPKGEQEKELYKIGREDLLNDPAFTSKRKPWDDQNSYGMGFHRALSKVGLGNLLGTPNEDGSMTLTEGGRFIYKLLDKFDLRIFTKRAKEIGFRRAVGFEGMAISGALDFFPLGIKYIASVNRAMPVKDEHGKFVKDENDEIVTRPSFDWRQIIGATLFSIGRFMQIANDSSTTELNLEQVAKWSAKLLVQTGLHNDAKAIQMLAKNANDMASKYERQHFVTVGELEHAIRQEISSMHSDIITLTDSKREIHMANDVSQRIDSALSKYAEIADHTRAPLPVLKKEDAQFIQSTGSLHQRPAPPQL